VVGASDQPGNLGGETVRRLLESWGWPAWGPDLVTDDFVMEQHGGTMEGVYSGEPGMREYAKGFGEAWSEATVEIEELIEHDELVVAMTRLRVRGISRLRRRDLVPMAR